MNRRKSIYFLLLAFICNLLQAQDIKKDVTVVKPYEPTVQNANKISMLPVFNDTNTINPVFEYNITPVRLDLAFQPRPVPAAKMAQEPIKKLYNNYVKLGYGNPYSPLAEISVTNGRSKENAAGIFLRHHSANGKVKLNENTSVDAPFADNEIDLYGKHLFRNSELSGNIYYKGNKTTFYGISPVSNQVYDKEDFDQHYQKAGFNVSLNSHHNDSNKLLYNISGGFRYLTDNYDIIENNFKLSGNAGKMYKNYFLGASADLNYYRPGSGNDTLFNTILNIRPYFGKRSELWRFELALGLTFDANNDETQFFPYPSALLEFNIAPSVLKAFISYQGFLESNNLDKIRMENPYILPGTRAKNTNYRTHLFGGFKGSFSESINFMASMAYSSIEDQYFFINDTLPNSVFHNYFQLVYDNIDKIQIAAEIDYSLNEKWNINTKANFYNYTTFRQEKPWHLPNFDLSLGLKYNLRNKIILTSEAFLIGERFAKNGIRNIVTLDPFVDVNLGIEYRYSKVLSAFVQIKNLTAAKYQIWNQYPAYRFQAMAGFTYMF